MDIMIIVASFMIDTHSALKAFVEQGDIDLP